MGAERPCGAKTVHSAASLRNDVHLWVATVAPGSPEVKRLQAAAGSAERARAARFHRLEDAERYLAAHGALRMILAGFMACDPVDLRFSTHGKGKPFIEGADLEFNLSHSGALALIAVALRRQVGVDIERLRPIPDLEDLVAGVCTAGERAALAALEEPVRERAFLGMWTRKEALVKMTGEGLDALSRADSREAHGGCRLVELRDLSGYAAWVAAEGSEWQLVRHYLNGR